MFASLATLLLAAPPCGPLDLDTALALAGRRSDEVAIRESERTAAEADRALAHAARIIPGASATLVTGPAPAAHGNVLNSDNSNRSLAGLAPFGRVDVQILQPLFTWGRLDAASDAAEAGVRARTLLVDDALAQVQLRVVQLFWGEALARRLLAIAAEVESALAEVDRRLSRSIASGKGEVGASDRYRVDLFRAQLKERKADAERGRELARIALAATLALPPQDLSLAQVTLEVAPAPVLEPGAVRSDAERRRPDLAALDQAMAARRAEIRAAEGARLPQFFLAGQFTYAYAPNRDLQLNPWVNDPFNQLVLGAVLGLRQDLALPLLSAQAEKARAELATLERQRAGLARLIEVQVDGALADLKAAADRLSAAEAARGAARSWFRSATLNYGVGVIEARDLLEAYAGYIESQAILAQSAYDVIVNRARLELATGAPPRRGEPKCILP